MVGRLPGNDRICSLGPKALFDFNITSIDCPNSESKVTAISADMLFIVLFGFHLICQTQT